MDSEKNTHMKELLEAGRPITDEGPYYHHAWWESYKGSVKGKLGGGLLGAALGAATGALAVIGIAVATATFPATALLIVSGFSAAGLIYGIHEFSEVGKIAGAVAASQKVAEKRVKEFEEGKFAEIKEDISELKAIVKGEPVPEKTAAAASAAIAQNQDDYRTSHFQGSKVDGIQKIFFWKIALVGLAVGLIAGAVMGYGGMAEHILHGLGAAQGGFGAVGNIAAPMVALGAIGASFGINRDIFRQIFDQTDLWFRGFVSHAHSRSTLLSKEPSIEPPQPEQTQAVLYDSHVQYPASSTHFRDQQLARAKQALMEMDHTHMSPH